MLVRPVGGIQSDWLSSIGHPVGDGLPRLPAAAFDARRRQFHAQRVLDALADAPGDDGSGRPQVLVTGADLFLPGRPFVFGACLPDRGVALVSIARLGDSAARLVSVIHHEAAHLAGLPHCAASRCVLRRADTVADIDDRGAAPCETCQQRLDRGHGGTR